MDLDLGTYGSKKSRKTMGAPLGDKTVAASVMISAP